MIQRVNKRITIYSTPLILSNNQPHDFWRELTIRVDNHTFKGPRICLAEEKQVITQLTQAITQRLCPETNETCDQGCSACIHQAPDPGRILEP